MRTCNLRMVRAPTYTLGCMQMRTTIEILTDIFFKNLRCSTCALPEHPTCVLACHSTFRSSRCSLSAEISTGMSSRNEASVITGLDFYYGDITRQKAENLLQPYRTDCFLLRDGALKGSFAVSVFRVGHVHDGEEEFDLMLVLLQPAASPGQQFIHALITKTTVGKFSFADHALCGGGKQLRSEIAHTALKPVCKCSQCAVVQSFSVTYATAAASHIPDLPHLESKY